MSQPPSPYERNYSFTDHSAQQPTIPQPGNKLDIEFNDILTTLNGTITRLNEIQRDDGKLRDSAVPFEHLIPGPKGDKGDQGIQGSQGIQGIQGIAGPAGVDGIQGPVGPVGPQGIQGLQGIQGVQGDKYAGTSTTSLVLSNGTKTFTTQAGLAWTSQQDITIVHDAGHHMHATVTSYDSATGIMVAQVTNHTGSVGPYSSWTINIEGAIGAQGPVGSQGPIGLTGPQGEQGIQGVQGPVGLTGPQGPLNPDGLTKTEASTTYATIENFNGGMNSKADFIHSHPISNIVNLQATLNQKAPLTHHHETNEIIGLDSQLNTINANINASLKRVIDASFSMVYTQGFLSIPAGADTAADRFTYNVPQLALGTRSWMIQRPEFLGKWIFLGVKNAENKRQTKGPRSYVEFTHTDFGVIAHGDLEYEDAGIIVSSYCDYQTIYDAEGTAWAGYYVPVQTVTNGTGGYTTSNGAAGTSGCHLPNGFVIELGTTQPLTFGWSDSEGHSGTFQYGYTQLGSKIADGTGGFNYSSSGNVITAYSGQVFHSDPGFCSGALELSYDGNAGYNTSDNRVSAPAADTYLYDSSGTYEAELCGSTYQLGSYSGAIYSDGSCSGTYFSGTTNYVPYGTYLTNCNDYSYYSNGSGSYYSEYTGGTGGCSGTTGNTDSGTLTVYISEVSQTVTAGSYDSTEYYNYDCTTYWSSTDNWYSNGTELYNDGTGNYYYSNGSGGYYHQYNSV